MDITWIKCSRCGNELAFVANVADGDTSACVQVDPCQTCLKREYNAGWDDADDDYDSWDYDDDDWEDDE